MSLYKRSTKCILFKLQGYRSQNISKIHGLLFVRWTYLKILHLHLPFIAILVDLATRESMKSRRSPASKSGPKETPFLPSKLLTA
ncbi:hypothetical protein X975_11381, partial [Stegodyphus mimosarum]